MKWVALVCKLMPLYRLGVFHELSKEKDGHIFMCFGDAKEQGGIKNIPWKLANDLSAGGVNWTKTSNYFYIPERLLWQTGIVRRIIHSPYQYFVFEGAIAHLPTWLYAVLCRIMGKKALFWTHGFVGRDHGLKKIVRTIYFKLPHALLLYSHYARNLMIENGFAPNKLFVVYNSLDTSRQMSVLQSCDPAVSAREKKQLFSTPGQFTAIFIGRLVREKKVDWVLEAVRTLRDDGRPINCIIIGDGPESDFIKAFISRYELEKTVYWAGPVYDEEVICKYFLMSDMMISPGNVGLNCVHSLTYGVPVLTHDNLKYQGPEVEAVIPGKTGLLYRHHDFKDLVAKIAEWRSMNWSGTVVLKNCHEVINKHYNSTAHAKNIVRAIDHI